jgi:hypothetical protein
MSGLYKPGVSRNSVTIVTSTDREDVNMVLASQGSGVYQFLVSQHRVATVIHGTQARPSAMHRVIEPYPSSSRRALAIATEHADGDHPAHSLSELPGQRE